MAADISAWLESSVDELYPIFEDGLKRLCLTDHVAHMADSKHGIVKNRFYIVFDMSKHLFKDMRTIISELEIDKMTTADRAVDRCTLHMTLKTVRDHEEVCVFKLFVA